MKVLHGRATASYAEIDEGMSERLTRGRQHNRFRRVIETDGETRNTLYVNLFDRLKGRRTVPSYITAHVLDAV